MFWETSNMKKQCIYGTNGVPAWLLLHVRRNLLDKIQTLTLSASQGHNVIVITVHTGYEHTRCRVYTSYRCCYKHHLRIIIRKHAGYVLRVVSSLISDIQCF